MSWPFDFQEVVDRLGIYDLYDRYVHAIDALDMETLECDIFTPDIVIDWTAAGGMRATWEQARVELLEKNPFPLMFHQSGNHRIDFDDDGVHARVKTKMIHPAGTPGPDGAPRMFQVQGGYDDVLVRTQHGWRIQERVWRPGWVVGPWREVPGGMPGMVEAAQNS